MSIINTSQLKSLISQVLQKIPKATIISFKSPNYWKGDKCLKVNNIQFYVFQCQSELAIREAILKAKESQLRLVIITNLDDRYISDDIIAIFAKRKLIPIKPWSGVKDLFKANKIDNSIIHKPWLANVLIESAPIDGYESAPIAFLSAERIWAEVLPITVGLNSPIPDIKDILKWSQDDSNIKNFKQLSDQKRNDILEWIELMSGHLCASLLKFVITDHYFNLLALGLAYDVTSSDNLDDPSILRDGSIRLEKYTLNTPLKKNDAILWSTAAKELFFYYIHNGEEKITKSIRGKLDYLLIEIGVIDYAYLSSVSLTGFEQRIEQYASELKKLFKKRNQPDFSLLNYFLNQIHDHQLAEKSKERIHRIDMSFRLIKWLWYEKNEKSKETNFLKIADNYVRDGGFIDSARRIISYGDNCSLLSNAYSWLIKKSQDKREEQNKHFTKLLVKWSSSGLQDKKIILIEQVLSQVLAKAAQKDQILFIVIDGLNYAVLSEFKNDLLINDSWVEVDLEDNSFHKPVIAAFPTVTDVCRRSLLCGKLTDNPKDNESKCFMSNEHLNNASGKLPPSLFHKADILNNDGTLSLSKELKGDISSSRRIVGVIINAVDDSLFKNDQISFLWRDELIPIFNQLLYEAKNKNRTVIIIGDHGHVSECQSRKLNFEGGERWRHNDEKPKEGEIIIKGQRVLKTEQHEIIAPWSERIRYSMKKNGYHGGLTPQEVLIPLCALKWEKANEGWVEIPYYQPEWWTILPQASVNIKTLSNHKKKSPKKEKKSSGLLANFEKKLEEKQKSFHQLIQSEIMQHQKKLCGRKDISDEKICSFLETIQSHGGTIMMPTLATELKLLSSRVIGFVAIMEKILNVDGFKVLSQDSKTVYLNEKLLREQFNV